MQKKQMGFKRVFAETEGKGEKEGIKGNALVGFFVFGGKIREKVGIVNLETTVLTGYE